MADPFQSAPPVLILLASKLGYQTRGFAEAGRRLGAEVIIGSDRCHQLEDPWADGAIALHFEEPRQAAARLADAVRNRLASQTKTAILALGDRQTVTAAHAARLLGLPYNPPEAVENCRSKLRQRQVLSRAGLPVPDFFSISVAEAVEDILPRVSFPCVVKPLSLSASQGVIRANNASEFAAAIARISRLLSSPEVQVTREGDLDRLLVERYIPGLEFALEGVLESGQLRTLAFFDKPDPLEGPYFEESIYVTPSRVASASQDQIIRCAQDAVHALGLSEGPVHAEFRLNDRGPWVLEIAPRPIGGLCSRVLRFGPDKMFLEELLIRRALGFPSEDLARERDAAAVMMIPVPCSGVLEKAEGVSEALAVPGIREIQITGRLHDYVSAWPEGSSYLGFIFASAANSDAAVAALRQAHSALRFTIRSRLPVAHPLSGRSA